MNETTQLNSELLSADARGRKHIPVAVFAVIVIHVVLFMVLLIAAGCRSSTRVKGTITPATEAAERRPMGRPPIADPVALQPAEPAGVPVAATTPAVATEPQIEPEPVGATTPTAQRARQVAQKAPTARPVIAKAAPKVRVSESRKFYVVKAGDTLEKIARQHGTTIQAVRTANKIKNDMIQPGQKLQLAPDGTRTAPLQVQSEKQKRSNEV